MQTDSQKPEVAVPCTGVVGDVSRAHDANGRRLRCDYCGEETPIDQEGASYQPAGYMRGDGWEEWEEESVMCKECMKKLEAHIEAEIKSLGLEAESSPIAELRDRPVSGAPEAEKGQ